MVKLMNHPTHITLDGQLVFEGGAPEGSVPLPQSYWVEHDLAAAKANVWNAAKAKRDAVALGGCETPLGRVDSDETSQGKITGAVVLAQLALATGSPFEILWTMQDNVRVAHNAPQMLAMGQAVGQHVAIAHAVAGGIREALSAATTLDELEAIDINGAPWPGQVTDPTG